MTDFDRNHLTELGFKGFRPLASVRRGDVPTDGGVYCVLLPTQAGQAPEFLETSVGGWFKGQDPTLPTDELREKWVPNAETLYVGRSKNLSRRIIELARFGHGEAVGHRGGRMLWQVPTHEAFEIAWMVDSDHVEAEARLLESFVISLGALPFANIQGPRARAFA